MHKEMVRKQYLFHSSSNQQAWTQIGKEALSKSIGERLEIKGGKGELGPGPGGYFNDKPKNHNISYSISNKLEDLSFKAKNFQPGPGRYESSDIKTIP